MNGRERILEALDGRAPTGSRSRSASTTWTPPRWRRPAPGATTSWTSAFVAFPVSPEEEDLRRRALPHPADTRLGNPSQAARYARWGYHPEADRDANPLEGARTLDDLERFPFPDVSGPYLVDGLTRQVAALHAPRPGGRRQHAAPRRRALRGGLAPAGPGDLPPRPRLPQGDGALPARPARRARPPQRRRPSPGPGSTSWPSTTTSGCRAR